MGRSVRATIGPSQVTMVPPGPHNLVRFLFELSSSPRLIAAEGTEELGHTPEEFVSGRVALLDRIHAGDRERFDSLLSREENSTPGKLCLRVRNAEGRIRCMQAEFTRTASRLTLVLEDASTVWKPLDHPGGMPEFRTLLEKIDSALFFKDRNHVFVAASPAFQRMMAPALAGRELLGCTDYDLIRETEADGFYLREQRVLDGGSDLQEVMEVSRPDADGLRWIHVRQYPVRDQHGEIVGLFTLPRDITESIQLEEKEPATADLVESREALRRTQQMAGLGSYIYDIHRGVFAVSSLVEGILGLDKSQVHSVEDWGQLLHPDDRGPTLNYFRRSVAAGQPLDIEYRIIRPRDKALRWVHGKGRIEFDAQGKPLLVRGSVQDITARKLTEAALREARNRFKLFIEQAPAALAMFDCEMRFLEVSRRWLEVFRMEGRNVLGHSFYNVFPDTPERWRDVHRRALGGEQQWSDEEAFRTPDGLEQWLRWEILPWRLGGGTIGGVVLFVEDITRQHESEERLRLAASVFEHASEAILVTDLEGHIVEVNEAFTWMFGYARSEVLGRNPRMLQSGRQSRAFYEDMWQAIREHGRWSGELWNRAKNGSLLVVQSTITTVLDPEGKPQYYVELCSDITAVKEHERQLQHIAHFDALTGLPNRVLLVERLRRAMVRCKDEGTRLAVAYLDLDAFKNINDLYGRAAADRLLVSVAAHMKRSLGEENTLARISGDEFIAILDRLPSSDAAIPSLEHLLRAVSEPVLCGEDQLQACASAGVTFYPQAKDVDADQLLRQADQAMYVAKLSGGNRFHLFDPEEDSSARGRHEELERIRQALHANEFVLHYQPKVNMATGELVGVEALIRWNHPERGLLPPAVFLPIVENHRLAIDIGEWVVETALTQGENWAAQGRRISISVNVGAEQLQQPDFVDRLKERLKAHPSLDPSCLGLEVLESSALEDLALVSRVIESCRRIGIHFSIDDFGTGYSSLTYLKSLPASILKVDQSFVRDMLDDPDDLAILQGVLGLATAFRRIPVAEGVETVAHGELLLKLGCQLAQGYGIAKPMPADRLLPWCDTWRPDPSWFDADPVNPADWPLLVAEVELRAWNKALQEFFGGERSNAPELDESRCRFGAWLETEKVGYLTGSKILATIEQVHVESHRLARRAVNSKMCGRLAEAVKLLSETLTLRGQLHELLTQLMSGTDRAPTRSAGRRTAASPSPTHG